MTYTLVEVIASECGVEADPDGARCDRCNEPDAMILTRFARLCHGCFEAVAEQGTGYARLAARREREWRAAVEDGFAADVFDELNDELDEPLREFAAAEIARACRRLP